MKKIRILLVLAVILSAFFLIPSGNASAKEKIKVYMFRGQGCPHCEEAIQFFSKLEKDDEYKNYYSLKKYEVWYNEKNAKLMESVAEELNKEASGVPFIVIGKKTFNGFSSEMEDEIKKAIKDNYESDSYKDIVKKVNNNQNGTKKEDNATVPIIITIGVAVLIIGGLVVLTKKI